MSNPESVPGMRTSRGTPGTRTEGARAAFEKHPPSARAGALCLPACLPGGFGTAGRGSLGQRQVGWQVQRLGGNAHSVLAVGPRTCGSIGQASWCDCTTFEVSTPPLGPQACDLPSVRPASTCQRVAEPQGPQVVQMRISSPGAPVRLSSPVSSAQSRFAAERPRWTESTISFRGCLWPPTTLTLTPRSRRPLSLLLSSSSLWNQISKLFHTCTFAPAMPTARRARTHCPQPHAMWTVPIHMPHAHMLTYTTHALIHTPRELTLTSCEDSLYLRCHPFQKAFPD